MAGRIVLDCSVAFAWCFLDESQPLTDAALGTVSEQGAIVPEIWPLEVVNVLLVAERRKRLTRADSEEFLGLLAALPIQVEPMPPMDRMASLLSLGRRCGLSSYDAAYLDLAMRRSLPLATLDTQLARAARKCHVSLLAGE